MIIKPGDFILTKDNRILEIITKGIYGVNSIYLLSDGTSVARNELRHIGKLIPREKVTETMLILYSKLLI